MDKTFILGKVKTMLRLAKPWFIAIAVFFAMRYTGMLSGLSVITNTALIHTGALNADVTPVPEEDREFNYDFSVKDLDGNVVDFKSFKGKVIFINLWATWCGPCRAEMPSIQKLYTSLGKEEVAFVMLSLDRPDQQHKIKPFLESKGFDFPVYVIHDGLTEQLDVRSIPTTFVVSKGGKIETREVGAANYNSKRFQKFLTELINRPG